MITSGHSYRARCVVVAAAILNGAVSAGRVAGALTPLEQGFRSPPAEARPSCYWYWISDNISKEGITRDLEAMARVGIGEAFIGNIFLDDIPAGTTKVLSEEWWQLVEHAIREGGRTGVKIGMFNCPGWSQSGGPWIGPHQAMRYLVSSEVRIQGPSRVEQILPKPKDDFQDVAVLAFPAPRHDGDSLDGYSPQLTCVPPAADTGKLIDRNTDTAIEIPRGNAFTVDIELAAPLTARSLALVPSGTAWSAQCQLQVERGDGTFTTVRVFRFDRSNMGVGVGPMPRGPVQVSFEATKAKRFRLVLRDIGGRGPAALAEIDLSPAARLESHVEKQLGKMHPTPLPMWKTYLWPPQAEPDAATLTVAPGGVIDLSSKCAPDGTLRWDAPDGDWVVVRMGMAPTGTRNSPASPEGQGREVDKMNRALATHHFDAFIGQLLKRMPAKDRKAFSRVIADSYEQGSQNWTDGFGAVFRRRYGYDPLPWLPALTGRIVGSADQSDRFLWDLRRLVADRIATEYVGGLREECRAHGLKLWLENYGHWGFPAEFLQYGGQSDSIGGEFWVTGSLGSIECRAASSAANTYGKATVSAEAFTGGPAFRNAPSALKARGDWAFCEGISHFVLHVYIQQPWEDRKPGMNAWFGTEFNRHNTWFEQGKAWIDYVQRSCFLLQQGNRVADVAYFIGEDTPKMTGIRIPELPAGYDFDYINAEVILEKLSVADGRLVLPHGTSYRVLVLPEQKTMRPELLQKLGELVEAGATVIGTPPSKSPSMENYPDCDERVRKLAAAMWSGRKQVLSEKDLNRVFGEMGVRPDFISQTPLSFTHRRTAEADIYFVTNPEPWDLTTLAAFRVADRAPELWWPDSGRTEQPAVYDARDGMLSLPLHLGPHGSVFVVFRDTPVDARRIVSVTRNSETLLDASASVVNRSGAGVPEETARITNNFTLAVWAKPEVDTVILAESDGGIRGLQNARNEAVIPTHGGIFADQGHAGCGLAIGRNGVGVFEHAGSYFAPLLIHATPLTDWTHVTIVYRDAQPQLYLNGRLAHTGLRSRYTVHPGETARKVGAPFMGGLGAVKRAPHAMTAEEVAALVRTMPMPSDPSAENAVTVTQNSEGRIEACVWQAGAYVMKTATGKHLSVTVASVPPAVSVAGPWTVQFTPGWGAPERIVFDKLADWTARPEDGIRHYSGTATYRRVFELPDGLERGKLLLDLGKVYDLATVRVNGRDVGTLWMEPWQVDISDAVRPGRNALEIDVVNAWNNRLVGDAGLPPKQRKTFLGKQTVGKNAPLQPAGLLGPVTVRPAVICDVD